MKLSIESHPEYYNEDGTMNPDYFFEFPEETEIRLAIKRSKDRNDAIDKILKHLDDEPITHTFCNQ